MSFDEIYTQGTAAILNSLGSLATYQPVMSDDPIPCHVIVDQDIKVVNAAGFVVETRTQLSFLVDEVPTPQHGDSITLADGRQWVLDIGVVHATDPAIHSWWVLL
jgi:hypothetical protein